MLTRKVTSLETAEFPVAQGNFDSNILPRDTIVLHTMAGYVTGTRKLFATPPSQRTGGQANKPTSAHYGIGMDGKIDHYLEEDLNAYGAGNYDINRRSINIEHEDFANPSITRTDLLYTSSSRLVADICKFYGIPCDTTHVIVHNRVPAPLDLKTKGYTYVPTGCPGTLDADRIITGAQQIIQGDSTFQEGSRVDYQTVKIISPLGANIRADATSKAARLGLLKTGQEITLEGFKDGETIDGNNKWLQLRGQLAYIWAGTTNWKYPVTATISPSSSVGGAPQVSSDETDALTLLKQAQAGLKEATLKATVEHLMKNSDAYLQIFSQNDKVTQSKSFIDWLSTFLGTNAKG